MNLPKAKLILLLLPTIPGPPRPVGFWQFIGGRTRLHAGIVMNIKNGEVRGNVTNWQM